MYSAGSIELLGTESLGVRGMSCIVRTGNQRVIIDPGVALGYKRHGYLPHPVQIAEGERVRCRLIAALENATDIVFSHFHGDHVPLKNANVYQLSFDQLPEHFRHARCWSKSLACLRQEMMRRAEDLQLLSGSNFRVAEGISEGTLSFSRAVPHGGVRGGIRGYVMMTRVDLGDKVFVHGSDIQLLEEKTIDHILDWRPDIVFVAGPPLYFKTQTDEWRQSVWDNGLKLARNVETVIIDHHLMRDMQGIQWLKALSRAAGRRVICGAEFMNRRPLLFEAQRTRLYDTIAVSPTWHEDYEKRFRNNTVVPL